MDVADVVLYTVLAGAAAPLGALLALVRLRMGHLREDVLHGAVALGGGLLLAAVALVLIPEGLDRLGALPVAGSFFGGAVAFMLLDRAIERRGGQVAQAMGMVVDFVPESVGLGAAFAAGPGGAGPLLALLIGLQNLPEGFNAFRELRDGGMGAARVFALLSGLVLLGPVCAVTGFLVLGSMPQVVAGLFLFAAGGLLYLVFHDIAPLAHQTGHWVPALGAVLGFLIGLLGDVILE